MRSQLNRKRGSALVISILVLFILTTLGMALMLTTSQETDISVNYRWGELAFFNADAGLEYAKNVLAGYATQTGDFSTVLPPARGPAAMNAPPVDGTSCSHSQAGCRDYQLALQQGNVMLYVGKVLRDQNGRQLLFDVRDPGNGVRGDIDGDGQEDIQGTLTIWVRRPLAGAEDYGFTGNLNDRVIVTSEGTAPNFSGSTEGRPGSLRRLEVTLRLPPPGVSGDRYSDATKGSDQTSANAANASQAAVTVQ